MAEQDEWSSDANEAVQISLVQPGEQTLKPISTFHPRFTYPIFGDEERIFGYRGLSIKLRFAAHDLYPNVAISYDTKFKQVGETKATDILEVLKDYLPKYAFDKTSTFKSLVQDKTSTSSFSPPGKLVDRYTSKGRDYEVWCGELTDQAVQLLLERMQIFVSFFVEGGTPLVLDDQEWTLARWRVFFVYEKLARPPTSTASPYSIVGYSTSYRFLTYQSTTSVTSQPFKFPPPTISVSALPSRARISQFLILPPYQSASHGTHLYRTMISTFLADSACTEITVEDPNEAFDDMRDYCDYTRLLSNNTFAQIQLNTSLDPKLTTKRIGVRVPTSRLLDKPLLRSLRLKNKLAPRQFDRLVEMYLLSQIPAHSRQSGTARLTQRGKSSDMGDRAFYYWRLLVKQRIYKKNKDVLMQLERGERIDKVEETLGEQAGDYERLLGGLEGKEGESADVGMRRDRAKRKVIAEDDEEDEENDGLEADDAMEGERQPKRRKEDDG